MYTCEGEVVYFVFQRTRLPFLKAQIKNLCPRQGLKIAGVVLHRVGIFGLFCPKQGQGLRPLAAHLYPNIGRVTPREPVRNGCPRLQPYFIGFCRVGVSQSKLFYVVKSTVQFVVCLFIFLADLVFCRSYVYLSSIIVRGPLHTLHFKDVRARVTREGERWRARPRNFKRAPAVRLSKIDVILTNVCQCCGENKKNGEWRWISRECSTLKGFIRNFVISMKLITDNTSKRKLYTSVTY